MAAASCFTFWMLLMRLWTSATPQTHAVMDSAIVELQALPITVKGSFVFWLDDMRQWKGERLMQACFAHPCSSSCCAVLATG